jgi:ribonuclease VapC
LSSCILDASAVLAILRREAGREQLISLLRSEEAAASAVNLSEVVAKLSEDGIPSEEIPELVERLRLEVIPFDADLAYRAGFLRPLTRRLGLSLGDRACLATAQQLTLPVYTGDRSWASLQLGIPVHVFR